MITIIDKNRLYKTPPVKIREFLTSPKYIGNMFIWESVVEDLVLLLSDDTPYRRGLFIEPPGSGKSSKGALFLLACLYKLANLKNPQSYFGLDEATLHVGVVNMSISSRTASGTIHYKLRKMLEVSPWFQKNCPVDSSVKSEIRLPDPVFAYSGNSSEAFPAGFDIFGAVVDEITMFLNKSHKGAYSDQVKNIVEVLEERTETRFMDEGYVLAMGASSYINDYVEETIKESESEGGNDIFVVRRPIWYAKPRSTYSGKYFLFDTDKMQILDGPDKGGLFSEENKKEIMEQITHGLSPVHEDISDRSVKRKSSDNSTPEKVQKPNMLSSISVV